MSNENSSFNPRAHFAAIVDQHEQKEEASAKSYRDSGLSDEDIAQLQDMMRIVFECIDKVFKESPNDDEAMFTIKTLQHYCRLMDEGEISQREVSLLRLLKDERDLDQLL
jgi:N-glycosylase/DNA lyase